MILYLVGPITHLNPIFAVSSIMVSKMPANAPVDVYISSSGGRIDHGIEFGRALSKLNATCYVQYAASAAFQVVMPGCKKIILAPSSKLVFHSATWCIQGMKDTADVFQDLRQGLEISSLMASLMNNYWGEAKCTPNLKKKYMGITNSCNVLHMLNETELTGIQFRDMFPKAPSIVTLVPQEVFPPIPTPIVQESSLKNDAPVCEVL